jgi:hypothetical protein
MFIALIIRCWLCCDPNCERTKEKLKEIKKKIFNCCPCCSNDNDFINDINNDINIETEDINVYDKKRAEHNNVLLRNIAIEDPTSKFPIQKNPSQHNSTQDIVEDRVDNIENDVRYVYFPIVYSTKRPSHSFVNIIQPTKPLPFVSIDIRLPPLMPFEKSEVVFEKYFLNIKEKRIFKLFYLKEDSEDEAFPIQQELTGGFDVFKSQFILFMERISMLKYPFKKHIVWSSIVRLKIMI